MHEQLYAAGSADRLGLRPYVARLVENLSRLHEGQSGPVRLDFSIEEVEFAPEVAVPLGLILNELVTNSLKYAFDGRDGTVSVCVETLGGAPSASASPTTGRGCPPNPASRRPAPAPG